MDQSFQIQVTEVTQCQYFFIMNENPSFFSAEVDCPSEHQEINGIHLCPNHPVEMLFWDDAQSFIARLNEREDGYGYRLPTELEWEFAARGGTDTDYFFGDDVTQLFRYAWYWNYSNSDYNLLDFFRDRRKGVPLPGSHAVAMLQPNPYHLYDIHGNAGEMVQNDPFVVRGGSWSDPPEDLRSDSRRRFPPQYLLSNHYLLLNFSFSIASDGPLDRSTETSNDPPRRIGFPRFLFYTIGFRLLRTRN